MTAYVLSGCICALAYVVQGYRLGHTVSPDGSMYLDIARGKAVPSPYSHRWLLPRILGTNWNVWRIVTACALLACSLELYALTHSVWSVWLWVWLPGTAQLMRHPVLVDAVALALALGAALLARHAVTTDGFWFAFVATILALLAALVREPSALFAGVLADNLAVFCVFLVTAFLMLPRGPKAKDIWRTVFHVSDPRSNESTLTRIAYLDHPFAEARKRHDWIDWKAMLLPWGMVLPLFVLGARWDSATLWACIALALGYGQLVAAQDGPRLFQWAAPAVLIVCARAELPWWVLAAHPFVCGMCREARK